jgi:hypothetical protein
MKNILIIFILFLSIQFASAQKQNCGWFGTMKPAERMKQFPFNKAKRIVLVSYPGSVDLPKKGSEEPTYIKTLNIDWGKSEHYGSPDKYKITEEKEITGKDVDDLSNLLINYTTKKGFKSNIIVEIKCYMPRNGVVFYDENDTVICFLEICFDCKQYHISPEVGNINYLNNVEDCGFERVDFLEGIFERNGVWHGLEKN